MQRILATSPAPGLPAKPPPGKTAEQLLNVKVNIQEHNLREKIAQVMHGCFLSHGFIFPPI